MRRIDKQREPKSLTVWKEDNPTGVYSDLEFGLRNDIRNSCLQEQYFLCAYCCQDIGKNDKDCMNEHVEARRIAPQRSLDFSNIVASCTTPHQCDYAHDSQSLSLTPFMKECESEFFYKISGRVEGLSSRAKDTIRVLNLGDHESHNRNLIEKRKRLANSLLFVNGINPDEGLDDDELLEMVIEDLQKPTNGKLSAFSPIAISILRSWLSS